MKHGNEDCIEVIMEENEALYMRVLEESKGEVVEADPNVPDETWTYERILRWQEEQGHVSRGYT